VFRDGVLASLASIGMGAADITDDIASAFGTRRAQAERLKCFHGSANMSPRDHHEMIDVAPISHEGEAEGARITRAQLNTVIRARLERLLAEIQKELKRLNFDDPVGRQIVLTGGGAELRGIADYAQQALGRAVRVGRPRGLSALPEAHSGPAFATLAGLATFAASDPVDLRGLDPGHQTVVRPKGMALFGRLMSAFKANY
jgi:cell division protein FtsA